MYKYILFDLDGTLTDSEIGITNGIMYALGKFGVKVNNRDELREFLGPPLLDSFMKYFSFSKDDALKAVEFYREYYSTTGIYENRLYNGINNLLKTLKKQDKILILATSKPQKFAEIVLNYFNIMQYFDCVVGATFDGKLNYKAEVISEAIKRGEVDNIKNAVMVGDRYHDILGAKQNGIDTIGVLYGFGSIEELKNTGADYIAKTPKDILKIIIDKQV